MLTKMELINLDTMKLDKEYILTQKPFEKVYYTFQDDPLYKYTVVIYQLIIHYSKRRILLVDTHFL